MGEKYLGQLTAKSAPATGDILVLEDSEDTKKIDYDALANAILNKLTTKTYTVAGGTNTLIAAIDALNSKHKYFNSTETDRNVAIHNIVSSIISNYSNGDAILCTLNFSGSLYCGFMWKGSATIMLGRFYRPNANGGFYFRDSTADSSATSTDFS